jgi:LysR family transcriptional regulator, regulator for metE and metH
MQNIEFRHLRLVKAIAERGTMTRAAGDLALTQSALSQQLLDLEGRLGVSLFVRTGRRMVPTEAGDGFIVRGERILGEVAALHEWLGSLKHGDVGTLRVSTDNILCLRWLPGAMQRFRARYPRVSVRIQRHRDLLRELSDGKLDVGITYPRSQAGSDIEFVPLFDDELLGIMPRDHPLRARPFLDVRDLSGQNLIYHMELKGSALARWFLDPHRIKLASVTVVEQPEAIIELVKSGFGVSILPRWSVERDVEAGELVARRIKADARTGYPLSWAAAVRKGAEKPFLREFLDQIRAQAAARYPPRLAAVSGP